MNEYRCAKSFYDDVKLHELQVLRDDGLYRHFRMSENGSFIHGFDIVTWPGELCITGDMGTFVFRRTEDMLRLFRGDRVNLQYWHEKLVSPRSAQEFSVEAFREAVLFWARDEMRCFDVDKRESFMESVQAQILDCHPLYENEAYELWYDFKFDGVDTSCIYGIGITDYSYQFVWCCHAIVYAIKAYDKQRVECQEATREKS